MKRERLDELYREYVLEHEDKETVLGCGNAETSLLLVGEAPGKDEVRLSRPFAGKAGGYLDEFLELLQIERDNIYITNAIKYRLSKVSPRTNRVSNRPAARDEVVQGRPWLFKEIDIIRPKYIVTLGNVPLRSVCGAFDINIGDVHGEASTVNILGRDYTLFALYHPASVIYNRGLKDTYIGDLRKLKDMI